VYPGENNLCKPRLSRTPDSFKSLFERNTAASSPGIRNYAVTAESIAAVLYLEKRPRMLGERFQMKALCIACNPDIGDENLRLFPKVPDER
jgi:hypothetical protein